MRVTAIRFVNIPPSTSSSSLRLLHRLTRFRRRVSRSFDGRPPSVFVPVELDCAGEIEGFSSRHQWELRDASVSLTSDFFPQTFAKGTCGYGRREDSSRRTFSVTVSGIGKDTSYGYVGGWAFAHQRRAPAIVE